MAYLYRHIRLDKNEPFYIGIGTTEDNYKRAYDTIQRSEFWKRIVKKSEYKVEIVLDELEDKDIFEKEKEFIALYGRKDLNTGTLCNLSNGGESNKGWKPSNEWRMAHSIKLKNRKMDKAWRDKLSKKKIGLFGRENNSTKIILNTQNGVFYFGLNEASKSIGMNPKTLQAQLTNRNTNKTFLIYA